MFVAWVVFHVIVCVALILVVLMQSSKGEGLAGTALGGGGSLSGAVFGGRGAASFLSKATTVLAIVFMFNCGALAYMSANSRPTTTGGTPAEQVEGESVVQRQAQQAVEQQQALQQQRVADSIANNQQAPVQLLSDSLTPAQPEGNGGGK